MRTAPSESRWRAVAEWATQRRLREGETQAAHGSATDTGGASGVKGLLTATRPWSYHQTNPTKRSGRVGKGGSGWVCFIG